MSFDLIRTKNNSHLIERDELQSVSPEYLLAKILKKMIAQLPNSIGKHDLEAVVSVPSNLSSSRINSISNVFKLANIKLNKLMSNIEAISLAHFYTMKHSTRYNDEKLALVYDLGGGKLEVSLMHISSHDIVYFTYGLYSSKIDHNLGSIDFEDRIIEFSIKEFYGATQVSLRKNKRALLLMRQAAIKALHELLKTKSKVRIKIEKISVKPDLDLDTTLTYEHFQLICEDLFRASRILVKRLFEGTEFSRRDVDEFILVGQAAFLLIESSQSGVERIDLIDKKVLGVALEAASKTGSFENRKNFFLLNNTRSQKANVSSKSKKKNTSEYKPYNLAPSYFVDTFKVILAAVLGIVVLIVLLLVLGWSLPKAPPPNTRGSSFQNRLNQTASEASPEENIGNHNLVYLRGVLSSWNNWVYMYNVNED